MMEHAIEEAHEKEEEMETEHVEFSTFDDDVLEKVLKRQDALTPEEFEKFIDDEKDK